VVSSSPPGAEFVRLVSHPLRWRILTELARSDLRVRELVTLAGEPQNLISYHLRVLRAGGLVTAGRSSFDGRDSYYHLDLDRCAEAWADAGAALHPMLGRVPVSRPRADDLSARPAVLFVCTGNSARSPIAEALVRRHSAGRVEVASGGSHPQDRLHPHAVRVLHDEFGIDVAGRRPRRLETVLDRRFDYVISLCDKAREVLPDLPGRPRLVHWSIPDPGRAGYPPFQRTAAEIDTRVRHLLEVLAPGRTEARGARN